MWFNTQNTPGRLLPWFVVKMYLNGVFTKISMYRIKDYVVYGSIGSNDLLSAP